MDEFLREADCAPNLNVVNLAGRVGSRVVHPKGDQKIVCFSIGYAKVWPTGHKSTEVIPCYTTGDAKVKALKTWLRQGEMVAIQGELGHRKEAGIEVYCHRIERLSKPTRAAG